MEHDEKEADHKQVLETVIRAYAIKELFTKSKALPISTIDALKSANSNIWSDLRSEAHNVNNFTINLKFKTEHGFVKIPPKEFQTLVQEIIAELVDEGFLIKNGIKYSLNTSSQELTDKALLVQQQNKPNPIVNAIGILIKSSILIGLVCLTGLFLLGFHFDGTAYQFGDGEIHPWNTGSSSLIGKLTPARDLTGSWTGTYNIKENADYSNFGGTYQAVFKFEQDGNKIKGSYTMNNYRSHSITGTISSSRIDFTDGFVRFSGSFTTDLLKINFETGSLNQYCYDPELVGKMLVPGALYDGEPGVKGTITLTRDR